jgi:hypothetical protein
MATQLPPAAWQELGPAISPELVPVESAGAAGSSVVPPQAVASVTSPTTSISKLFWTLVFIVSCSR